VGTPIRHPLIDDVTSHVVRVDSRARVVRLSAPLADLLGRGRSRRRIVLVTGEASRLTVGARAALVGAGAAWAVHDDHGGLRDGLTGSPWADLNSAGTSAEPDVGDQAAEAGRAAVVQEAVGTTAQLSVDLTVLHRASHDTSLGGAVELLAEAVAASQPDRWGETEPLRRPWDRWVLTQHARHAAPELVRIVVEGPHLSGTVTARVTEHGIEETTALTLSVPTEGEGGGDFDGRDGDAVDAAVSRLAAALSDIARTSLPTFALVVARRGEPDRSVRAVTYPQPNPVLLLIGAPSVARLGIEATSIPVPRGVSVVGRPRLPALVVPLGDASTSGWEALHDTLEAVGPDRVADMVSGGPPESWHDDLDDPDSPEEARPGAP
jgi:hypothetical protein